MTGFDKLGLPPAVLEALARMGYAEPTPVQAAALPPLLAGRDALVEAETGSGKTAAFGLPAIVEGSRTRGLGVLVLVPTRELARQVAEEMRELGTGSPFRAVAVTGGVQEEAEERQLAGDVRAIVATPGRLVALLEARRVRLDAVRLLVLDEADRMLDMGFSEDVERVLAAAPTQRQTVFVSATLPAEVRALGARHLRDPAEVRVGGAIPASLDHFRINVFQGQKHAALDALLRKENPERAIVFVRTRAFATATTRHLKQAGFAADALQGDMSHDQRRHVFDLFQRGTTRILVATDLASRGLDVPEMQLVVNLDLPEEDEQYLHRAGRAARFGRSGRVVSIVLPDEKARRMELEAEAGLQFAPYRIEFDPNPPPPPAAPAPAARGKTPPSKGPKGNAAQGKALQGKAPQGKAPQGTAARGKVPDTRAPRGNAPSPNLAGASPARKPGSGKPANARPANRGPPLGKPANANPATRKPTRAQAEGDAKPPRKGATAKPAFKKRSTPGGPGAKPATRNGRRPPAHPAGRTGRSRGPRRNDARD